MSRLKTIIEGLDPIMHSGWVTPYEWFGTAIGLSRAIDYTCSLLNDEILSQIYGSDGATSEPIIQRTLLLGACQPSHLIRVAKGWMRPVNLPAQSFPYLYAWNTAIPFLRRAETINREEVDTPELSVVVEEAWYNPDNSVVSWRELLQEQTTNDRTPTRENIFQLRRIAKHTLSEHQLSAEDLLHAPMSMWLLLQGKTKVLDASAKDLIISYALDWKNPAHNNQITLVVQLCRELNVDKILITLEEDVSRELQQWNMPVIRAAQEVVLGLYTKDS